MSVIPEPERSKIYTRIKHLLGAPLRSVEVTDEMMDSLMELSIQDYEQYILNWLIDSQWVNLVNLNMTEKSVAKALITRTMDFEQQFSYSYSKIVGLQAEGPWVLKKDYIILERNKQNYEIPAGREINEVLWFSNQPLTAFGMGGIGGLAAAMGGMGGLGKNVRLDTNAIDRMEKKEKLKENAKRRVEIKRLQEHAELLRREEQQRAHAEMQRQLAAKYSLQQGTAQDTYTFRLEGEAAQEKSFIHPDLLKEMEEEDKQKALKNSLSTQQKKKKKHKK